MGGPPLSSPAGTTSPTQHLSLRRPEEGSEDTSSTSAWRQDLSSPLRTRTATSHPEAAGTKEVALRRPIACGWQEEIEGREQGDPPTGKINLSQPLKHCLSTIYARGPAPVPQDGNYDSLLTRGSQGWSSPLGQPSWHCGTAERQESPSEGHGGAWALTTLFEPWIQQSLNPDVHLDLPVTESISHPLAEAGLSCVSAPCDQEGPDEPSKCLQKRKVII